MSELVNSIEISISCRKLKDMDVFSKSDPIVAVYEIDETLQKYREIGRTEIIWNNLNPNFATKFTMDYHFEECQKMKFEVYDIDNVKSRDLSKQDFIGDCITTLGEIVASGVLEKPLKKGAKTDRGFIRVKAEEKSRCMDELTLEFCGRKLDRKDFFGLSDPFLTFSRADEDGTRTVCYRTEKIKTTLSPHWKQFKISMQRLCNGDQDRAIYIECFDWNKNGSHALIGEFSVTARELLVWPKCTTEFPLIHPDKQRKKKSYKNSGTIHLLFCQKERIYSFIEFIQGGLEMCCTISVDFTKSNGDPRSPNSLHHLNRHTPTQYAMALEAVGEIIQDYDSDKLFPAFGFGARLPPTEEVSHCFPLNGNFQEPSCDGIAGVLGAYHQTLESVTLFGPTNFAPSINKVAAEAAANRDGSQYFILLILTDGVISDLPQTKEAIVRASALPLSIIIVGIGNADFEAMDVLDGDEVRLSHNGRQAERDIVQFVPFRDFLTKSRNTAIVKHALAKAVLEEVPGQLVSFMRSQNIKPRPIPLSHRLSMSSTGSSQSASLQRTSMHENPNRQSFVPCAGAAGISRKPPPYSL